MSVNRRRHSRPKRRRYDLAGQQLIHGISQGYIDLSINSCHDLVAISSLNRSYNDVFNHVQRLNINGVPLMTNLISYYVMKMMSRIYREIQYKIGMSGRRAPFHVRESLRYILPLMKDLETGDLVLDSGQLVNFCNWWEPREILLKQQRIIGGDMMDNSVDVGNRAFPSEDDWNEFQLFERILE